MLIDFQDIVLNFQQDAIMASLAQLVYLYLDLRKY